MRHWIVIATVLLPLSTSMKPEGSLPAEVEVALLGNVKIEGEILFVRDSSIIMATQYGLSEAELIKNSNQIVLIPNSRITTVQSLGGSYAALGIFGGLILGCLGGSALVGRPSSDCNARPTGAALGGMMGAVAGGAVCGSIREGGEVYIAQNGEHDFSLLRPLARYNVEPDFLRAVSRYLKSPGR